MDIAKDILKEWEGVIRDLLKGDIRVYVIIGIVIFGLILLFLFVRKRKNSYHYSDNKRRDDKYKK